MEVSTTGLGLLLVVVACMVVRLGLLKWNEKRYCSHKTGLPPGTMGWPLFGETLPFLKHGPDFMKKQVSRYGKVFKTHIFGGPMVISTDRELNRYLFMNEAKGIVPGYPQSSVDIQGRTNIAAVYGPAHKRIRGSLISLIGPPLVKDQLSHKVDKYMKKYLQNWDGKTLDIQEKSNQMIFYIVFKLLMERESSSMLEALNLEFDLLFRGALSLPINFPGTQYYNGLKARKKIINLLTEIIEERKKEVSSIDCDMFDYLLSHSDSNFELSVEEIMDQVMTILHSGNETMSKTAMMLTKYLHENPKALQELREEHFKIREKKRLDEPLDWDDYKSMTFTRAVILETSRLATIVNGVLRKTTKEMELNGYIIPKGWRLYLYTRGINYDPFIYPEPSSFNPWRWLDAHGTHDKNLESHNYLFFWGGGTRLCPGKELGINVLSTFLHYFVTSYRWDFVGGEKIDIFPRVEAPKGLHIRVSKY